MTQLHWSIQIAVLWGAFLLGYAVARLTRSRKRHRRSHASTLSVSPILNRLALASGATQTDVIERALQLYETTLEQASMGHVIKFVPESAPCNPLSTAPLLFRPRRGKALVAAGQSK